MPIVGHLTREEQEAWDSTIAPMAERLAEEAAKPLRARIEELEAVLEQLDQSQGHVSGMYCASFFGEPCSCGHEAISRVFGSAPTSALATAQASKERMEQTIVSRNEAMIERLKRGSK